MQTCFAFYFKQKSFKYLSLSRMFVLDFFCKTLNNLRIFPLAPNYLPRAWNKDFPIFQNGCYNKNIANKCIVYINLTNL